MGTTYNDTCGYSGCSNGKFLSKTPHQDLTPKKFNGRFKSFKLELNEYFANFIKILA